jgi:hypothetical protein
MIHYIDDVTFDGGAPPVVNPGFILATNKNSSAY